MIDLAKTQASLLARPEPIAPPASWRHFLDSGSPPQELAKASRWGETGPPEGARRLQALCSPSPDQLIELYAWLKRESIKAPIDSALIVIICERDQLDRALQSASALGLAASKFLLLPTEIKTHFY